MDINGPHSAMVMLDVNGSSTEWPFPGGSVRWTNIGLVDGQNFDLLTTLRTPSIFKYVRPDILEDG
eukprot:4019077-Prymnesium_polylepis.2